MKEDFFFAPRPKFATSARWVRGFAVFYAIAISALFCLLHLSYLTTFRTEQLRGFIAAREPADWIVAVLIHTVMLVPAWRCWYLRRWGVLFITIVLAAWAFGLIATVANAADRLSLKMGLLALVSWQGLFFWAACVADQWRHLKPDF